MINWRKKDFNTPPISLVNQTRINAQILAETDQDGDHIRSSHYNTEEVSNLLRAYSIGKDNFDKDKDLAKCFYCESTSEVVATLQVEHYRPKKVVHDENRRIVPNTNGYYWLGLEWTNLVFACSKCNGRGAKGNIFTIKGNRERIGSSLNPNNGLNRSNCYANKSPLKDEKPDLLHPEIDNSYRYLKFNRDGEISHKLKRGELTIKYCKLDRRGLNIARYQLIETFESSFLEVVGWQEEGIIHMNQVYEIFTERLGKI